MKGSKIKLKITPDIDATATPNYKEIVKKAFEEVCEHYGKAKLLQTLGTQVLQAVAKCGVPEAADLVAGGEAGGEAVAIVGAGAAVATVVVVVVVVVLVAVAVKYYETKADVAKTKVLVGDIVSDAWMGWRAGLLRFSPPSGDVGQAAFQKGSEAWHKTIEKVRAQNKHASDKAIMEAVHKEMLKVANDKSHFPEIVKQTREQVWKQYSAKYKDENVRKQIWENINGKPDGFPG